MKMFNPAAQHRSPRHVKLFAIYEILVTTADFSAALLFIMGSILFFSENTAYTGTWLFLIGSIFFALKPSIRLIREWHYLQIGEVNTLAKRARE